jgi:integrase
VARGRNTQTVKGIEAAISKASRTRQRVELSDGGGLVLRCLPSGAAHWTYAYRSKAAGKMRRVTLGSYGDKLPALSLSAAREARDVEQARNTKGEDPRVAQSRKRTEHKKEAITFGELCDQYTAYIKANDPRTGKPRRASWKNTEGFLKRPKAKFGKRAIGSLERSEIRDFLKSVANEAPVLANRTQAAIRAMWGYANDESILTENFLHGMKRVGGRETAKDRVLTSTELRTFFTALDADDAGATDTVRRALKLVLLTAQRPGEVAGMMLSELHDLDGPKPHWIIPAVRTKNKKSEHTVPLSPTAVRLIVQALEKADKSETNEKPRVDQPVFASRFTGVNTLARLSMSHAVRRVLADMEDDVRLTAFTPHDLRRTAATMVQAARLPVDYVKALLNHNDKGVTGVYARWHMFEEKREAVLAIEGAVAHILA